MESRLVEMSSLCHTWPFNLPVSQLTLEGTALIFAPGWVAALTFKGKAILSALEAPRISAAAHRSGHYDGKGTTVES